MRHLSCAYPGGVETRHLLLAHRGKDDRPAGRSDFSSLDQSLRDGFGVEFDVRDWNQRLVISHDPPGQQVRLLNDALSTWTQLPSIEGRLLAINVKSDGLVREFLNLHETLMGFRYFFFDMSFPQSLQYMRADLPVAIRLSEYESATSISGIGSSPRYYWVDSFSSDWWLDSDFWDELDPDAAPVIVSPELHGRDPRRVWDWWLEQVALGQQIYLCTDHPSALAHELGDRN